MIRNISQGDIAKILSAHRAAERSKAVNGLGYLRSIQDDEPVEVTPTRPDDFYDESEYSEKENDNEQKEFEEVLKFVGAMALLAFLDKHETPKKVGKSSLLEWHQRCLDARKSKRKSSELVEILNILIR